MRDTISNINDLIAERAKDIYSLKNFYDTIILVEDDSVSRIPIGDFFSTYKTELAPAIQFFQLNEEYFYQPKSLSEYLYGTTELWLALLRVNNMRNITEFHLPIIKIYNPNALMNLIKIFFKRENIL